MQLVDDLTIIVERITVGTTIEGMIADVMMVVADEMECVVTTATDEAITLVNAMTGETETMATVETTTEMADAEAIPAGHVSRAVMGTIAMVGIDVTVMEITTAISQKTPKFTIFRGSSRL